MNVLKKLTKRNLSLNKKRTIMTGIGIVLSTALIICVAGMVTSFQGTIIESTKKSEGNYHAEIKNMNRVDALALLENRNILDYYLTSEIGYAKIPSINQAKPYLYLMGYDEKALHNLGISVVEGRYPKNSSELIMSNHVLDNGGISYHLGDTITLEVGERQSFDGITLHQNNPFQNEEEDASHNEKIINLEKKTYTIVGFMERLSYTHESYSAPGYTAITYQDNIDKNINAFLLYKNPKNYLQYTKEISNNKYDYDYNHEYLRFLGVTKSSTMRALYNVAAVVIAIIILSSVFVIKNSFAISITEKYKMYGMLRSVGATKKQIKKNVLYEGFLIGLIAIPLGILCGILAIVILLLILNILLKDLLGNIKFVYSVPLFAILLSILLGSITIFLSTIFTARKASKITAIEAIRSNNDIKIKGKKLRTPKIIKKLFSTGGVIAYKNLKRNKKKYRTTVISIIVSVFIFIALSSFITFGFKMSNIYYMNLSYNMTISDGLRNENTDMEEIIEHLKTISGMEEIDHFSLTRSDIISVDPSHLSDFGNNVYRHLGMKPEKSEINITVFALGEGEYQRYLKELGLNNEANRRKGILIDDWQENYEKKLYLGNMFNFKNNEILTGKINDNQDFQIEIIRSDKRPMGLENYNAMDGILIVSDEVMDTYFHPRSAYLYVEAKDADALEIKLNTLQKENPDFKYLSINNLEKMVEEENTIVLVISIFLYGFITVISLIGITNIFKTITTNMNLRSKEFAMLKSIGMTNQEFNRMIRLESIFYGFKSLIIGIPLGIIGSYLIYLSIRSGIEMPYELPIKAILLAILFVSFMIGLIMKYSLSKINKQNIIETIRNDNI